MSWSDVPYIPLDQLQTQDAPPQEPPPQEPPPQATSWDQVPYLPPEQAQAQMTTPQAAPQQAPVISPGLGAGSAYQAQPPPEQAAPPAQPGEWYSGAADAAGALAGATRDAGAALLAGDVGTATSTLLEPVGRALEVPAARLNEREAAQDRLEPSDLLEDPSQVMDIIPTAVFAPGLYGPGEGQGPILPEGAPGALNEPFNQIGAALTTPIPGTENLAPPPTAPGAISQALIGETFDSWLARNPERAAQVAADQGEAAVYETYKADNNATSNPPKDWSNPLDAGAGAGNLLQSAQQVAGGLIGGGSPLEPIVKSYQSGELESFARGTIADLFMDPTVPAQLLTLGLGGAAGTAGRAAASAGRPGLARALGTVSKTAETASRLTDIYSGDPTAAASLARDAGRGLVRPTQEGLSQLQSNQILETTGNYRNAITTAGAPPPITPARVAPDPYAPVAPGATPEPRVTPGVPDSPVPPNGRQALAPDLAQPVTDSQGRSLSAAPGRPTPDIVAPTTGQPLVSVAERSPHLARIERDLQSVIDARHVDAVVRVLENVEMERRFPQVREFIEGGQAMPGGAFQATGSERLIAIAADAARTGQAPRFLDHESIHAARHVFTDKEWATLHEAAQRAPGLADQVRDLYPGLETSDPAMFAEEMVAALYTAVRHDGLVIDAPTRNLIQKLIDFLKSLGKGVNAALPADVIRAFDNGEIGKRARTAAEGQAINAYSRYRGTVFHGSSQYDLDTISANVPDAERGFDNAGSQMGAYFTRDYYTAENYANADRFRNKPQGDVYRADLALDNTADMRLSEFQDRLDSQWGPDAQEMGRLYRGELESQGYDGMTIWEDGQRHIPRLPSPGDYDRVDQIVSFRDVPARPTGNPLDVLDNGERDLGEVMADIEDAIRADPHADVDPELRMELMTAIQNSPWRDIVKQKLYATDALTDNIPWARRILEIEHGAPLNADEAFRREDKRIRDEERRAKLMEQANAFINAGQVNPRFARQAGGLAQDEVSRLMRGWLDEMGLKDVGLEMRDSMGWLEGEYDTAAKVIRISMEASDTGFATADEALFRRLLDHEAVHAMRDLGLLSQQEFDVLLHEAHSVPGNRPGKSSAESTLDRTKGGYPGSYEADEIVADLFADWHFGSRELSPEARSVLDSLLHRLRQLATKVRESLNGPQAESIMQAMADGEIGARERRPRVPEKTRKPGAWPPKWDTDYYQTRTPNGGYGLTDEQMIALQERGIPRRTEAGPRLDNRGQVVFSRRENDPRTDLVRDWMQESITLPDGREVPGANLTPRDPTFISRFRQMLAGKTPDEIRREMDAPLLPPRTKITTLDPAWDAHSLQRWNDIVEWAKAHFDFNPRTGAPYALNDEGLTRTEAALAQFPTLRPPSAEMVDRALHQSRGSAWWYPLSGQAIDTMGFTPEEARQYPKMVAATSPRVEPDANQRMALALMSEGRRGMAGNAPALIPAGVERVFQDLELGSDKTENFDRTLAYHSDQARAAGTNLTASPVVDIWQARVYNAPTAAADSEILNAIISRHIISDADEVQRLAGDKLPMVAGRRAKMEPHMMQAATWDLLRNNWDFTHDRPTVSSPRQMVQKPFSEGGSDYWSALRRTEDWLNEPERLAVRGGEVLSPIDFDNPMLAESLVPNLKLAEERPRLLLEFGTRNTTTGVRADALLRNLSRLPPDHPALDAILNGGRATADEVRRGAPTTLTGVYQAQRRAYDQVFKDRIIDRLAAVLMDEPGFRLARADTHSFGTWGGTLNPNLDLPTWGMARQEIVRMPQEVIERIAFTLAHAFRQDGAAVNTWAWRDVPDEALNSRIIHLPGFHLEESPKKSVKALPGEIERIRQVAESLGWPTQVTAGKRALQIKFIDVGGNPITDDAVEAILDQVGYTGPVEGVRAAHTSTYVGAQDDLGYARYIDNPRHADVFRGDEIVRRDAYGEPLPDSLVERGRMGANNWDVGTRQSVLRAAADLRAIHDTHSGSLDASLPFLTERVSRALHAAGDAWRASPDDARRLAELSQTGGVSRNFPTNAEQLVEQPVLDRLAPRTRDEVVRDFWDTHLLPGPDEHFRNTDLPPDAVPVEGPFRYGEQPPTIMPVPETRTMHSGGLADRIQEGAAERLRAHAEQNPLRGPGAQDALFARRPRSASSSLTALGHISGRQRERMLANTDPNARLGYHGFVLDPTTDQLLRHTLDVHWRDGTRARGQEFGILIEETSAKLERFIQLTRDPALRASVQPEFDRLEKLFVPQDGTTPVDFAALGGPGSAGKQAFLKSRVVGETIADAVERGLPKSAKGSSAGLMGQLGGALDEYSRVRGMFGLFAVWNIPKYFSQNWVGNGIMTALKKPSALPPYLARLRDVRQTAKEVSGGRYSSYDARIAKMGVSAIPTVDNIDKAQIGGRRGKMIPDATNPLAKAARPFLSEKAMAWAQTGDYAQRQAVAEDVIDSGYAVLNRNLPRITVENVRKAAGSRTPLPYTDAQIRTAVGEFLDSKRAMTDLNTGEVYKDRLGRVAKFEPIYTAEEFQTAMKTKLLAINNRVDTTVLNDALHRMWSDVELAKRGTVDMVKREVEDIAFSWVPTNVSEAMRKVVMYPYWTTKAGMAYTRYMLSHPAAAAAYGRMMQDMEDRSEALGMPDWMQSFFRLMNTPMGMEVWYSPTDLLSTFFTFPDWAMESGAKPWDDLTGLGRGASDIPFLLNPLISLGLYATGLGGPDYKPPDVLGVNKGTTLAASLLNMANAHGLLPDWIGKDEHGEIVPINPRPVDELVGRVGNALSTALQGVTGLPPVPVPNVGGSQASDITRWIEQNERIANPEMSQEDINARVTRVMLDHESPEYRRALEQMATQALTLGGGLDLPLTPEGFDRALEAVLRISSPISITAGPEQKFLDSQAKGMTPSGEVPPRNIPGLGEIDPVTHLPTQAAEDAQHIADAAKYGASATLASRAFSEEVNGYYDGRDPDGMGEIAGINSALRLSQEEQAAGNLAGPSEPVTIGGYTYTPDEIAGMDWQTRRMLADAYLAEQGVSRDQIDAYYQNRDAFEQQYYADHPLVGSYINDFKNQAGYSEQEKLTYVGALMTVNPAYAQFVYDHALRDGQVDTGAALSPDAFLASQGIAPSNYDPLVSPPVVGPGREPPPYSPPQPDVAPMAPLHMRAGPGTEYAAQMTIQPGTPLLSGATQGAWTQVTVPGQETSGWVATEYLSPMNGTTPAGAPPAAAGSDPFSGLGGAVASLIDSAGAVVGTMAGALGFGSKPAQTSAGKPYMAYDVVPANDGIGVQSTRDGSDRTWMEQMIGPNHAEVHVEYKGPAPAGVSYAYQVGHGAIDGEHAAYDIGCDDPNGNCVGTPMYAPMGGRVVCSGYGDGTGEAVGSPNCTYSQNTTLPGQAHTIVIEVGRDRNGNPIQLSFNHMGTSTLKAGQTIKAGDMIGTMGNTDKGPHVHLEGWVGDAATGYQIVDPQLIVGGYYFSGVPAMR